MSKITLSARMESCALRLPGVCNFNPATTVWAHSNELLGGKAKGKKLARVDHIGAYACYACHMTYDGQAKRPDGMAIDFVRTAFARAMVESEEKLRAKGLWPTDEFLASKPVTVAKPIIKKVVDLATRTARAAKAKSREPVSAGRGFPSRKMTTASDDDQSKSKRIIPQRLAKETKTASRWGTRKLVSGGKLQSRPFGGR